MAHGELGPVEDYANMQVTATMDGDTYAMLAAVLLNWTNEHDEDEARPFIEAFKTIQWKRTR